MVVLWDTKDFLIGLPTLMHRNIGGVLLFSSFEGSISEQETEETDCLQDSTTMATDKILAQKTWVIIHGIKPNVIK